MERLKLIAGLVMLVAAAAVLRWAISVPLPDIAGTWVHVSGDQALGKECTISSDTVTITEVTYPFHLERSEDGLVLLRLQPDAPALPLQRHGDQLLIMGLHGGEYQRQ